MKKYIVLIIFAVIAVGVSSCKKDNTNKLVNQDDELMAKSKKVISLIKKFDGKMSSNLKSGESISVDSAVWNMEALQNYEHANPGEATKNFEVAKSNYTLDLDENGQVLMSDVQAVYAQMEDMLALKLEQIPSDEKVVRFADVSLDSIEGSTAYVSTTLGFGYTWLLNRYWPFNTSDNWYWGTLSQEYGDPPLGKCDGTQYGVSDASDQLQWRLNNPVVAPVDPFIWTDLETNEYVNGFDHLNPTTGEPRLYVGWDYPEENCLTHDMLTNYLLESHYIINDYAEGVRPAGKSFASVYIDDDLYFLPNNQGLHYHRYAVTYGTMVKVGLPY
ncbi:MAG: hypothetical protein WC341_11645 [Bacteroidales bacterium]|jgi:hypothetical protein